MGAPMISLASLTLAGLVTHCLSFGITTPSIVGRRRCSKSHFPLSDAASSTSFEALESDVNEEGIGAWIPIASASALKGLGPERIEVMGQELVVWEANGTWSVMSDICPHRFAPLSQGRADPETNCIECPYHGWQFSTNGTLMDIPQLEANRSVDSIKGGHANALPVHQAGDLVFAFLPSAVHGEMFPQSLLPEDMYSTLREEMARNATYYTRDLPYSADFLIENFMDPAHIPFAHHSLQSVRSDAREIPMSVYVSNFTHVEVFFEDESRGKIREYVLSTCVIICSNCSRVTHVLLLDCVNSLLVALCLGSALPCTTFAPNATMESMPRISIYSLLPSKLVDLVSCSRHASFLGFPLG